MKINISQGYRSLIVLVLYAPILDARAQAIRIFERPTELLLFMLAIPLLLTIIAGVGVHRRPAGGPYVRSVLIYWFAMIVIFAGITVGSGGLGVFAPIILLFSPWLLAFAMIAGFFTVKKIDGNIVTQRETSENPNI